MLRSLLAALFLAFAAPLAAQEVVAPNPDIEATIQGQFDAFRAGDVSGAWTFAKPQHSGPFPHRGKTSPAWSEQGYPMVWNPGEVDFIDLQSLGGLLVQRVQVVDAQGNAHYLGYAMVETDAGWRINGVQVLRAPDLGV